MSVHIAASYRKHARCPKCGALERHRIQRLVLDQLLNNLDTSSLKMLHFAPEPCFRDFFTERFGGYETADIDMDDVDHRVDLQELPFEDETYDFVFASHVLEHVRHDNKAVAEIRRILQPRAVSTSVRQPVSEFTEAPPRARSGKGPGRREAVAVCL